MRAAVGLALLVGVGLAACKESTDGTSSSEHALTASELTLYMAYSAYFAGGEHATSSTAKGDPVLSDRDRQHVLQSARAAKATMCSDNSQCLLEAVIEFRLSLCLPGEPDSAHCDGIAIGTEVGWVPLFTRYKAEFNTLTSYLESQNFEADGFHETMRNFRRTVGTLHNEVKEASLRTSAIIGQTAHNRLAREGAIATGPEQAHLAQTRLTVAALDRATIQYQSDLNSLQGTYGEVAARHRAYRDTEDEVFAEISAIAVAASNAALSDLASLKLSLKAVSDNENRGPQQLILEAKRLHGDFAGAQAKYENGLAPHMEYLTEKSIPVLDHTGAPRTGMINVTKYAETRMQRVNDAVLAIYNGVRRREAALVLVATDAAIRDQVRSADAAQREAEFLNDTTARATAIWKSPPVSALNLPLQGERYTAMTAFLQLEAICKDLAQSATWRAPGCQKVASELSKIRTYTSQTLPFILRFGVQQMRTAGFDATVLADVEAKVTAGELAQAVKIYDAILRAAEGV